LGLGVLVGVDVRVVVVVGVGDGTNPHSALPSIILGLSQEDIQAEHMTAPPGK
jgi:hypothetical protein